MRTLLGCALLLTQAFVSPASDLEAYFIDVEGGKATLIVSPAGESLLIDTGFPGFNNRDADRIVYGFTVRTNKSLQEAGEFVCTLETRSR